MSREQPQCKRGEQSDPQSLHFKVRCGDVVVWCVWCVVLWWGGGVVWWYGVCGVMWCGGVVVWCGGMCGVLVCDLSPRR